MARWLPPALRGHYLTRLGLSEALDLPPPSLAVFLERELPLWAATGAEHRARLDGALAWMRYRALHAPEIIRREVVVRILSSWLWIDAAYR